MTCRVTKLGDDAFMISCSRGQQQKRCRCGRKATKLCDFPLRGAMKGRTCDQPICNRCAVKKGENIDYCPPHARWVETEDAQ